MQRTLLHELTPGRRIGQFSSLAVLILLGVSLKEQHRILLIRPMINTRPSGFFRVEYTANCGLLSMKV